MRTTDGIEIKKGRCNCNTIDRVQYSSHDIKEAGIFLLTSSVSESEQSQLTSSSSLFPKPSSMENIIFLHKQESEFQKISAKHILQFSINDMKQFSLSKMKKQDRTDSSESKKTKSKDTRL